MKSRAKKFGIERGRLRFHGYRRLSTHLRADSPESTSPAKAAGTSPRRAPAPKRIDVSAIASRAADLSAASSRGAALELALRRGMSALHASAGGIEAFGARRASIWIGVARAESAALRRELSGMRSVVGSALRRGKMLWLGSRTRWRARRPRSLSRGRAILCVPIRIGGRTLGAMVFRSVTERRVRGPDRLLLLELSRECAHALERARLRAAWVRARGATEALRRWACFEGRAVEALLRSRPAEALERLAQAAVPAVADWCAIDRIDSHGRAGRAACAFAGGVHGASPAVFEAARTRRPVLVHAAAGSGGAHAVMLVPLSADHEVVAVLTLGRTRSSRRYGVADVRLSQDVARRVSLALERALDSGDLDRMKETFLSTLSHELRTPLNAILGWARLLRRQVFDDATRAQALSSIERNAREQARIVNDLLDAACMIAGTVHLQTRQLDFTSLVSAGIAEMEPTARAKEISIAADLAPVFVLGDEERLRQVLRNLLANAVKFTAKRGHVGVQLRQRGTCAFLTVTDDGGGIESKFLPDVFTAFRQADGTTARPHGGLGLGLSLARHLVQLHGGNISADSEGAGRGATFCVVLPALSPSCRTSLE